MDRLSFLRLFHPIGDVEYQLIEGQLKERHFSRGEMITVPGQIQRNLYFVESGVQMSYSEHNGKQHVIAFTYPPNLCAIPESFSFQAPSAYSLTCLMESHMQYLSFQTLEKLFDQSQQIERLFRRMTEAVLAGIISRHIELQTSSIEERYKSFCQRSGHLLQLVPHKYIASYLNIDPTNFSKLYNNIKF